MPKRHRVKRPGVRKPPWYKTPAIVVPILVALLGIVGAAITQQLIPRVFAPKTLRATLSNLRVETSVPLKQYLHDSKFSTESYDPKELDQLGYLIYFQAEIEGFKGRKCELRWSMYDSEKKSKIELPEPWNKMENIQRPMDLTPEGASDTAAANFWAPAIDPNRAVFVRLELLDDNGTILTLADTESIQLKAPVKVSP